MENLYRFYGTRCAVKDISFSLSRGEVLGFLGPNGAGKSSTMKMLSGNLSPSRGSIRIQGFDILAKPKSAKALLGYLPEQPPLYDELTVDEYLSLCAALHRVATGKRNTAVSRAKERCGLSGNGKRLIANLSKGFRQRVGIAQAIIHQPPLVILDEPTVGLDPIQIQEIRTLIRELAQDHGVILCSHILSEIQSTCDRIQIINQGELVYSADMGQLKSQANRIIAAFDNPPAMADLEQIATAAHIRRLEDGRFEFSDFPDQDWLDAIMAEAVRHDWKLRELSPINESLEQIFIELTCHDRVESEGEAE